MTNTENIEIVVDLSSTFWKLAPKAKVYIDNNLIFDAEVKGPHKIQWAGVLENGDHSLIVELYDKDKYQTVLEDGQIIKDQLLNIDAVSFDDIDIGFLKHTLSNYYPNTQVETIKNCVNLGVNGKWELKFKSPIYIWLLEHM